MAVLAGVVGTAIVTGATALVFARRSATPEVNEGAIIATATVMIVWGFMAFSAWSLYLDAHYPDAERKVLEATERSDAEANRDAASSALATAADDPQEITDGEDDEATAHPSDTTSSNELPLVLELALLIFLVVIFLGLAALLVSFVWNNLVADRRKRDALNHDRLVLRRAVEKMASDVASKAQDAVSEGAESNGRQPKLVAMVLVAIVGALVVAGYGAAWLITHHDDRLPHCHACSTRWPPGPCTSPG